MIKASYFPVKYVLMTPTKRENNARIAPVQPRRYSNVQENVESSSLKPLMRRRNSRNVAGPVLPLKAAGEKAPLSEAVPNGHKDASTEIDLIEVWWSSHRGFTILKKY